VTIAFQVHPARPQPALAAPSFHQWVFPDGTPWTSFHRTQSGYLLRFPELADFDVSADGYRVACTPAPGVSDGSVRHLYLNQVLPLAQSRHGKLMFHASAVQLNAGCVAFMGVSGLGKSTLAASFATNGHSFLTDDGLEVRFESGHPMATPSHPSIRLWQDSEEALLAAGAPKAEPVHYTSKARFLAQDAMSYCEEPQPMLAVYVLHGAPTDRVIIDRVSPAAAVKELVKHSFLLDFEEQDSLATHFDELARLVQSLPLFSLNYPRDFAALPEVRRAVAQHAGALPRTAASS
jgi:hypothetical protein